MRRTSSRSRCTADRRRVHLLYGLSPRNAGTFIFDNATRRTSSGQGHTGSNRITRGTGASRIYGYNNETTEFGFRSVVVAADGLREETVKGGS
jgi:hypothetical protein